MINDRVKFNKYLKGHGIEIGALHSPQEIKSTLINSIEYVDLFTKEQLNSIYPELAGRYLVDVDVVDNASRLMKFKDNSLDFIIANLVLEQLLNPLFALYTWIDKLNPYGVICLSVSEMQNTFDSLRKDTTITHLLSEKDYQINYSPDSIDLVDQHYEEWVRLVIKCPVNQRFDRIKSLLAQKYPINMHPFTYSSLTDLLEYVCKQKSDVKLEFISQGINNPNENYAILQKYP